ncbi:MAG: beta-propeller fold lactonase family protein [Gammaproteobacteria bacterium]|nr:beta-propeller fold lactonase family protein [Gammaproteobacteria bacterium]
MRKLLLQIATGCLCLSGALITQASEVFPENIFVTLKDSGEIVRYEGQSVWKGDPVMLYNSITPDGQRLVVSSPKTGSVYIFDTRTHKRLAKIEVGKAPKGLKVSPDGKEAYVANEAEATVSVVDLVNYKTVATISVDKTPHNIRFSNDGKQAYVTLQGGAGLGVINTQTRKYVKTIPTPGIPNPHNLDLSTDGKTVYIRDLGNSVGVLDLTSEKMKKVITVGQGHAGIDIAPDGKYIFTGAIADDVVTVIDAQNLNVVKKIKVGFGPHGVRSSKDGRWLYVAITAEDKFVVIDTRTFGIVQEHNIPSFPFWIAVNGNP